MTVGTDQPEWLPVFQYAKKCMVIISIAQCYFEWTIHLRWTGYWTHLPDRPLHITTVNNILAISLVGNRMGASEENLTRTNIENNNKCKNDMNNYFLWDQILDDGWHRPTRVTASLPMVHTSIRSSPPFPHLLIPPVLPPSSNVRAASSWSAETSRQEKWLFWVRFQH